ncbi:MAG: zinc ribbon domain-containing protein [Clostridia bacterium]|nr:zinc ribbon domain-containing protein [Clostridia bacterium]
MKEFFRNLGYKMQQMMVGRYGADELSNAMTIGSVVLLLISMFSVRLRFLYYIALALIVYSIFRIYSKDQARRRREREWYLGITGKVKGFFSLMKRKWTDRKTHVYVKCPGCGKQLRVPKGKGKLRITCPGCGKVIEKNT